MFSVLVAGTWGNCSISHEIREKKALVKCYVKDIMEKFKEQINKKRKQSVA